MKDLSLENWDSDTYREFLAKKITAKVMPQIAGYYQVNAKFAQVKKDVLTAIIDALKEEGIG
jgi:hypothetical protein